MKSVLISSCFLNLWSVVKIKTPQWMLISLVVQTFLSALLVGVMKNTWASYILFLVFLGGLLIIFSYVGGLTAKVKLEICFDRTMMLLSGVAVSLIVMVNEVSLLFSFSENFNSNKMELLSAAGCISGKFVYSYAVVYLLLTLTCVCWVVKVYEGPLRLLS